MNGAESLGRCKHAGHSHHAMSARAANDIRLDIGTDQKPAANIMQTVHILDRKHSASTNQHARRCKLRRLLN
ncbi:hypothetical protein FQZ97_1132560 [compost metagenome]